MRDVRSSKLCSMYPSPLVSLDSPSDMFSHLLLLLLRFLQTYFHHLPLDAFQFQMFHLHKYSGVLVQLIGPCFQIALLLVVEDIVFKLLIGRSRGGVLPYKKFIGMCRWMGSHFHDCSDYNEVAFSIDLLEWGRKIFGFWG